MLEGLKLFGKQYLIFWGVTVISWWLFIQKVKILIFLNLLIFTLIGFLIFLISYALFRFWHLRASFYAPIASLIPFFYMSVNLIKNLTDRGIVLILSFVVTWVLCYVLLWRTEKV